MEEYKLGLIGYPLGHSLSAVIHKAGFQSIGLEGSYEILETEQEDLVTRIKDLRSNGFHGFNVTIPLKVPMSLFLDANMPVAFMLPRLSSFFLRLSFPVMPE